MSWRLDLIASYAHKPSKNLPKTLRFGEGLIGQCAYEKKRILLTDVPRDYLRVVSVLGSTAPFEHHHAAGDVRRRASRR